VSIGKTQQYIALKQEQPRYSVWKQVCFSVWNNGKSNGYKVNTQPGEQLIADKYAHVIIMKVEESLSIVGVLLFTRW
jgi:hypothetical protein